MINIDIIERQIFPNGGYQVRIGKDKVFLDVCKDGKCFSKDMPLLEFYSWTLKDECRKLREEIKKATERL